MKRLAAVLALMALAAAPMPASAQERPAGPPPGGEKPGGAEGAARNSYANPSAVIAAELGFARLAREKGQWTAFRETAAPDAVMFAQDGVPGMVLAQPWLKNRADPAVSLTWQPHHVWSSCDGALVVTTGAWQRGGAQGWFTTVWQRQDKGGYKWVFDHGDSLAQPLVAPDMIGATVADCPAVTRRTGPPPGEPRGGRPPRPAKPPKALPVPFDPTAREGRSPDGTLVWRVTADAAGAHAFTAQLRQDGELRDIRSERVGASPER